MNKRFIYVALIAAILCVFSCKNMPSQNHGPITLGDSSSIVTETNPEKLKDLVTELEPAIPAAESKDNAPATAQSVAPPKTADTAKKTVESKPTPPPAAGGLNADFNIASVVIPNINVKQAGNHDLGHANGAVYTLIGGSIPGSLLKVTANVLKVSQRYQSVVVVKNEMGALPLESLATTTDWEALKGTNNIYKCTGLEEKLLEVPDGNRNTIRTAVQRAAQRRRMSRRKVEEWMESVRNVRSANQKPLFITLRSVMWKIDGKDANGKVFSKQVRVDIPL
jgi:hypothetical protein